VRARGIVPGLGVLLVGDNPGLPLLCHRPRKRPVRNRVAFRGSHLPPPPRRTEILAVVRRFNRDPRIHGILVQLAVARCRIEHRGAGNGGPGQGCGRLPPGQRGPHDAGPARASCPARRTASCRCSSGPASRPGAHAVVVGRSNIVGRPLANLLSQKSPSSATPP
jgi:methylenetetrahydrofolate dehydrogenase (NADP+)/methenyltetrahydrofolate cyclohydrolase